MKIALKLILLAILLLAFYWLWSAKDFKHNHGDTIAYQQTMGLPMTFAHADHAQQQCVSCHHNYQDASGQGLCLDCHRSNQQIAYQRRHQFHALCMGCHIEQQSVGEPAGPLRSCKDCHTADQRP